MILVTGGAGYIGSVLLRKLLEKGERVRVLDTMFFTDIGIKEIMDKVEIVQKDIRDVDESVLDGVDSVIHLAGLSNDPTAEYNPVANEEMNTVATEKLAKLCKKVGVRRLVFASSASIYDLGFFAPDDIKTEDSPVEPRAAYAVSKFKAERVLLELMDENFSPVILRQGTVFGFSPRMRYDLVVNTFVKDALTKGRLRLNCGGEMWRPLVHVNDAANAFILLSEAVEKDVKGQIFNLCYRNFRISELALRVKTTLFEHFGIEVDIEADYSSFKTRSYRMSNEKLKKTLGYVPETTVEDAVVDMVKKIEEYRYDDFLNPIYYNIKWMTMLDEMSKTIKKLGRIF